MDALTVHRLHFAFTAVFHYLFPQLTMGLALLLVILKTQALRTGKECYNHAARFWGRIFGINFAMGVVTGIPMEFQFGTNWAMFSAPAGSSARRSRWKACFLSSWNRAFSAFSCSATRGSAPPPLACRVDALSRILAVRLLHHCDQCLDAASGRLPAFA